MIQPHPAKLTTGPVCFCLLLLIVCSKSIRLTKKPLPYPTPGLLSIFIPGWNSREWRPSSRYPMHSSCMKVPQISISKDPVSWCQFLRSRVWPYLLLLMNIKTQKWVDWKPYYSRVKLGGNCLRNRLLNPCRWGQVCQFTAESLMLTMVPGSNTCWLTAEPGIDQRSFLRLFHHTVPKRPRKVSVARKEKVGWLLDTIHYKVIRNLLDLNPVGGRWVLFLLIGGNHFEQEIRADEWHHQ